MGSNISNEKRLIKVTGGNLRNNHIYITKNFDFFPIDCYGASSLRKSKGGKGRTMSIRLEGVGETVETDIARDARTGKPRREFRRRSWVKGFFEHHGIKAGDVLELERIGPRDYRLGVLDNTNEEDLTFAEFFAGIGLVRMGLEEMGWKIRFANDIDPAKLEMYQRQFVDAERHFDTTDVHLLSAEKVPTVVLATASFPCTDLSLAGGREGLNGKQSIAFYGFTHVIEEMHQRRPILILLENVVGFLTSHGGRDFEEAMRTLNRLGYSVDPFILDAKWFVPQSRPRLFVVGINSELTQGKGFALETRLRPKIVMDFIASHSGIRWALRDLPEPPKDSGKRIKDIVESDNGVETEWWNRERAEYLYSQLSPKHLKIAQDMMAQKRWSYATIFRRVRLQTDGIKRSMAELRSDGIAGCLRTPKGGSGRQILFKAGYGKYFTRLLTPKECARLMGAPNYKINVPLNQALFGFGDAVCVPAIAWIAKHYLNPVLAELRARDTGTKQKLLD